MRMLPALTVALTLAAPIQASPFAFRIGFWNNLHQFLYVLGRARNGAPDLTRRAVADAPKELEALSDRSAAERAAWDAAIRFYADGPSRLDLVFDKTTLVRDTRALAAAPDEADLSGLGLAADLVSALRQAAPVYRALWWPAHQRADAAKRDELQHLLDANGAPLVERLTAVYHTRWPAQARTVELSAYAGWAGAYSTDGGLIVLASTDTATHGPTALEILLHEASHQWDDEVGARLLRAAAAQHRAVPDLLSHAIIFYTSGDVVKERFPDHVPYAEKYGLWRQRGLGAFKPLLDRYWQPYLRGTGTLDEALAALVANAP